MADLLEFEEPIGILLKEIEALSMLPTTEDRNREIARLEARIASIRGELYKNLTAWQRVLVARHPARPTTLDYVERLFTDFVELHGDRRFADDHAIVAGMADYKGKPVLVVGHQKGSDTKQKIFRNFGYARPEGYRKALRLMTLAEKFARPIICFVDTPAAYPGIESEERGVAEAIALNLREMAMLEVPVVVVVHGEGGSGGALGIAVGDRVLMHEFAIYSVIPPEGCAAILWRDANRKVEAAEALKITAPDLLRLGIIDEIVSEPVGGAHTDPKQAAALLDVALDRALQQVSALDTDARLEARYQKFRAMGQVGIESPRVIPRIWETHSCEPAAADILARELGVSPVTARLLAIRGLHDLDEAKRFLAPSLDQLLDPFRLADMERAVVRLERAIAQRERIAVHGDYDVDGITSTVILRRTLELLGGDVVHFVPERLRDGYGLQPATFDRLKAEGVQLVVSVDCGIRGAEAARRARDLGIDLIITDHHEPDDELPDAVAVVNPKRHDCAYPDKNLAGVGVALKLVQALCGRAGRSAWVPGFVKVAAIGTLADVVPLVGENRVIAKLGLEMLSKGPHKVGLRSLLEASSLIGKTIDSYHISFMLAPRINAAGRMSTPDIAARLLLASDEGMAAEARALAEQLELENTRRRTEEQDIVSKARKIVETDPEVGSRSVLVVAGEGWHRGVIGIVASKLVDAFYRPAIVLSIEDGVAHGSCRSIPGFDMLAALESCAPLMSRFGGHKQAAGLQIEAARVRELRHAVNAHADERLEPDDLRPRLWLDGPLAFGAISDRVVVELASLAPFGPANPRPKFFTGPVEVVDGPRRLKERHLKMTFRQDGRLLRGIHWNAAEREETLATQKAGVELAYTLEENEFRGEKYLELRVEDFR